MALELRHQTYFVYLDVPIDVRQKLNRRVFRQTLRTDSRSVATRRAAPLIAQWKAEIARAREEPNHNDAKFWRDALRRAPNDEQRAAILDQIDMVAWDIGATNVEHIGDRPSSDPEARRFYVEAVGARTPTNEYLDEWIGSLQVKEKTAQMRRATVTRLTEKFPTLQDVTRPTVRRWVTELVSDLKPASVARMTSDWRSYWSYLKTIQVVQEETAPFDHLGLKVQRSSWLPFEPSDAVKLLTAAQNRGDNQLADLIRLAMYTGARREELSALPAERVKADRFEIADSKTEAGVRVVPIHPKLAATMRRLVDKSKDGYVLTGLKPNKNGDRGDVLGKRFATLKRGLGFGNRQVFHSFRGTVITMLERAGVPESTVQDIVGHARSTLTGSTYSGKSTFEMRQKAINKLVY